MAATRSWATRAGNTAPHDASSPSSSSPPSFSATASASAQGPRLPTKNAQNHSHPQLRQSLARARRERLLFVYAVMVGEVVDVEVRSGAVYRGVFSASNVAAEENPDQGVVLRMARLVRSPVRPDRVLDGASSSSNSNSAAAITTSATTAAIATSKIANANAANTKTGAKQYPSFTPILVVRALDLVQLSATNVSLEGDTRTDPHPVATKHNHTASTRFATDSEISGTGPTHIGRQLEKFDHFSPPQKPSVEETGSLAGLLDASAPGKWDQFKANEKFGVTTSYNEHDFTTRLNRSAPDFYQKSRDANRLAAEIESKTSRNAHVMEDRGAKLHADIDEETMYGAVAQTTPPSSAPNDHTLPNQHQNTSHASFAAVLRGTTTPQSSPLGAEPRTPNSATSAGPASSDRVHRTTSSSPSEPRYPARPPSRNQSTESFPALAAEAASRLRAIAGSASLLKASKQVRKSLSGAASPGSGSRSPLSSSLVGDPVAMASLNLDRSTPKITTEVSNKFEEYKASKATEHKAERLRNLKDKGTSNLIRSPSITAKDNQTSRKSSPSDTKPPADARSGASSDGGTAEPSTPLPKKKLNPNARPFSLNTSATEFRPGAPVPAHPSGSGQDTYGQRVSVGSPSHHAHPIVSMGPTGPTYVSTGMPPPGMDGRTTVTSQQYMVPRYTVQADPRLYQPMGYPVQQMAMGVPAPTGPYYPYGTVRQGYPVASGQYMVPPSHPVGRGRGRGQWATPQEHQSYHHPQTSGVSHQSSPRGDQGPTGHAPQA